MAENADVERWWVFARFYVLRRPNIKKRFSSTFFMEFLDIRSRDVWTVHEWLRSTWLGTLASSVICKLREFSSDQPSPFLIYFFTYSGIKSSLPYPTHMLRAHYISMSLATVIWECSLNQFCTSLFVNRKFVCTPGATTNIYGRKYRIQG